MKSRRLTTGQIAELIAIDEMRAREGSGGIRQEVQELIAHLTSGGAKKPSKPSKQIEYFTSVADTDVPQEHRAALNSEFFTSSPYHGNSPGQSAAVDVTSPNIVVVPDMAAVDLTALVEEELDLTYIDSDYRLWDYYRGNNGAEISGRGRQYEVLIWKPELKPNETISSAVVRNHFEELKAFGHAGAFMQWRRVCGLNGFHASILEDTSCYRPASGDLYVPYSSFGDGRRELDQGWLGHGWNGGWSFVGFREISS